MKKVTVGLSVHRPEMLPLLSDLISRHDALFLEEPRAPDFDSMLEGSLSVDDYLLHMDFEYPEFSRDLCRLMRRLKKEGKEIFQVEPFLDHLAEIHEFFASGGKPEALKPLSIQFKVYGAEKKATGALISYYKTVMCGSFENAVEAIRQFARADAARFRLRDTLRAQALSELVGNHESSFVEAGVIHFPIWRMLHKLVGDKVYVRPVFVADRALETLGERHHLYGPGDQLTLLYIFHPHIRDKERELLLAARALVYAKIIEKQEITDKTTVFPHLRDELSCIRTVRQLSLEDCSRLFSSVRRVGTIQARKLVARYLGRLKH